MDFGIASVAAITVICYLVGLVVKASPWNNDKYIPIACGLVGILLSVSGNPRLDKEKLIRQLEEILSGELLQLETRGQVSETQSSSRL